MNTDDFTWARASLELFPPDNRKAPLEQLLRVERLWLATGNALQVTLERALNLERFHDALVDLRSPLELAQQEAWAIDSVLCDPAYYRPIPNEATQIVRGLYRTLAAEIDAVIFCLPSRRLQRPSRRISWRDCEKATSESNLPAPQPTDVFQCDD